MAENEDRERVAYHEAGHASLHYLLDVPFRHVTIIAEGDMLGYVRPCSAWADPLKAMEGIAQDTPWHKVRREHMLMIYLAGQVAETVIYGLAGDVDQGPGSDFNTVADMVLSEHMAGEEADSYIAYLWARTKNLLAMDPGRAYLEAIKTALLERGRLTSREAKAILRQTWAR